MLELLPCRYRLNRWNCPSRRRYQYWICIPVVAQLVQKSRSFRLHPTDGAVVEITSTANGEFELTETVSDLLRYKPRLF